MTIVHQRIINQRLAGNYCSSVADLVRWMGAVQAQEYIPSLWGLGVRLDPGITEDIVRSAFAEATIVRTWLMRGTIHYAPAEDLVWMVELLGRRINKKYRPYYERVGLNEAVFNKGKQVLLHALSGYSQLTRKELYAAFERAGIADPSKHGRGSFILQYWSQEGMICFGPYKGKQQTFVLVNYWIRDHTIMTGDDALVELTLRYFASHGPATQQDFAWWSGLTAAEVKHGIAMAGKRLVGVTDANKQYWMSSKSLSISDQSPKPTAWLLPCFDEYTVGYRDRTAALDSSLMKQLGYAVNYNNIIVDGIIVGTWRRADNKSEKPVILDFLDEATHMQRRLVGAAVQQYARFIVN